MMLIVSCALLLLLLSSTSPNSVVVFGFPQGAPTEACELLSPNRGHHTVAQPLEESPYHFIQYARDYRRGDMIGVEIFTKHDDQSFRGFIVQAIDPQTFEFIGHFLPGEGLRLMPECSAVTHENARDKSAAALVWMPPDDRHWGEVIFRATIVANKNTYYENQISQVVPLPVLGAGDGNGQDVHGHNEDEEEGQRNNRIH